MAEYIERDVAINAIKTYAGCKECDSYKGVRCRACSFDDAMSAVDDAPAADVVEVVHGRWMLMENDDGEWLECSVCGKQIDDASPTNFCDDCGAKMDKEDS